MPTARPGANGGLDMSFDPVSYLLGKQAGGGGGGVTVEPLSVTENDVYTAPSGKAYSPVTVNVPTGGQRVASGEFTLVNETGTVEIVHGLDTQDVFVTLQRVNEDHSPINGTTRYRILAVSVFDPASFIDNAQGYTFDNGTTQAMLNQNDEATGNFAGITSYFGTETAIATTKTQISRQSYGITSKTNNSVVVTGNYLFLTGRWVWKVYKLG